MEPWNQFPAMTTSHTLRWRDPQVWRWYADIGWATAMAPTINRKWNKVIIGVGEKQKVVMHYLPDTSPGSPNQMAPSMTRPCRFMNVYESIVLSSSSSGFLGILEADFSPRSCLDPYIRTMSLSEWMGGQQHTWRIATNYALMLLWLTNKYKWLLTWQASHRYMQMHRDTSMQPIITQ